MLKSILHFIETILLLNLKTKEKEIVKDVYYVNNKAVFETFTKDKEYWI